MLRATNRPILAYFDAIKNLKLRQLALILKAGYDPNLMVNSRGSNGLQYMINYFGATEAHFRLQVPINKASYLRVAKLLLDSGLDPNTVDLLAGESVLFDAIRFNDKDMVALLLNYADLSLRNKNGETALMCCARFGSKQMMRMLLEHLRHLEMDGYFLRQRNRFGLTALELARAENLECAKVLTKHLIAFGHHTSAVLARSSSHQLLPRAHLSPYARATAATSYAGVHSPAAAAGLLAAAGDDSASDYDSDVVLGAPASLHQRRAGPSGHQRAAYKSAGYFDPKAAEFNQYLLEQQDFAAAEQQQQQQQQQASVSDDEDYFGPQGGSGLTRSRSCMLAGQAGGSKAQKYSAGSPGGGSKKCAGSGSDTQAKMGGPSWEGGPGR